jgi:hypothetical protein
LTDVRCVLVLFTFALATACSGASSDPAYGSLMRVAGAQYVAGPTPAGSDGPVVAALDLKTNTIWPGYADKPVAGALGETATAVTLALSGDRGFWITNAGAPDVSAPTLPTFQASASFSKTIEPGGYALEAHAVDADGRFGPPKRTLLTALSDPPSLAAPEGNLVVSLTWDTNADLDLHVVDPLGQEIYHGQSTTLDTFSPGSSAADGGGYGYLDVDSNGNCLIDGWRRENVIWVGPPPSGAYIVRVDTPSLCGQTSAHFTLEARLEGALLGQASGTSLDSDTWGPHDRGAGLTVLTFDVP